jgi:hypothetical protein
LRSEHAGGLFVVPARRDGSKIRRLIAVDLVSDEMSEEELERYECVKATRRPPSPRE